MRTLWNTLALAAGAALPLLAQQLPRPAETFGFEPGADYQLAD